MTPLSTPDRRVMGAGTLVLLLVSILLWREFYEPGYTAWNVFLTVFSIALWIAAFLLQRYLREHIGEVGEARFDTRNKSNG